MHKLSNDKFLGSCDYENTIGVIQNRDSCRNKLLTKELIGMTLILCKTDHSIRGYIA